MPPIRERSSLSPDPEAEQELEHFLDSSHKVTCQNLRKKTKIEFHANHRDVNECRPFSILRMGKDYQSTVIFWMDSKFLGQVRHHLAEVKNREEREAQKKRRENMMLLMIAMEQKLSTTSVNYCRDLLENRSSNSKSM